MSSKEKLVATIAVLRELKKLYNKEPRKKNKTHRRYWVKPSLIRRCEFDIDANLLNDILWEDDEKDFRNFSLLTVHEFEEVLQLVHRSLKKTDTCMRAALSPRIKLAVTLRYLAKGGSYKSLESLTRVSRSTIGIFIPVVLRALYDALNMEYLKVPDSEEEWKSIADDFNCIWQFPHTMGALDGKHIRIKAQSKSGSNFYNLKGFFTTVLFALVDAHSRFIFIDVGCNGKPTDSTIYQDGFLCNGLENGHLNIPKDASLVSTQGNKVPYFFIGDDAFRLDKHLMKPYNSSLNLNIQQEIFNYRICRARLVVECAFGRLAKRFNIFNRPIEVQPATIDLVVKTCCVLHNYLTKTKNTPMPIDVEVDIQPETFSSIGQQENKTHKYAYRVRDELSRYLIGDGNVDFQWM